MITIDDLLEAAFTEPQRAYEHAEARIEQASLAERSGLLRVMGNARRELRRTDEAVLLLRRSVAVAQEAQDRELEAMAEIVADGNWNDDREAVFKTAIETFKSTQAW